MRFRLGKVPPDPSFDPTRGGWMKCREPNIAVMWILAIPIAALLVVVTSIAIGSVNDPSAKIVLKPGDITIARMITLGIGYFISVLFVHELVHLVAHPRFGLSGDSVLGVWPKAGVCYAFYGGELSRNRFVFIIGFPLLALTVVPVVVFHIASRVNMWFAPLAAINALGASFDVLVIGMVLWQVPATATMRNNGWDTYWRISEESNKKGCITAE